MFRDEWLGFHGGVADFDLETLGVILKLSWALLPSEEGEPSAGAETISPRSRDCVGGTERLPFSSTPSERAGLRHVQARGTSPATTPEGLEEQSQRGTTRSGKSRLPFLFFSVHWAFCVNVCGRRLWDKVKPCKCCRVFGFIRVFLLCAFRVFLLCAICVIELLFFMCY